MPSEAFRIRLDAIAQVNPTRRVRKGQSVPFVEMAALPQHSRDIAAADIQTREAKGAGSRFQNGDTLLARITPCLENGKTALVRSLRPGQVGEGSTEFIVLCGVEPADNDFIYYLCRHLEFRQYAIGRMEGTSGRQRVAWQSVAGFEFCCPPPPARREAAKLLSLLDDRIDLLCQANTTLESIARALFKSWFIDFDPVRAKQAGREPEGMDAATAALFPAEFEESAPDPIPKGWVRGSIYDIARVRYGASFASKLFNEEGVGRPLVRIRDLKDEAPGIWTPEEHPKGYVLRPGDIVVGMDGEFRAYLWGGEPAWMNQRICVFEPRDGHCAAFIRGAIAAPLAHVEATETATTVIHLGKGDIDRFRTVVPPPGVARAFGELCKPLYDRIVSGKQRARTLAALRDTLLPRLISGKLRLSEAREQLEAALA